MSTPVDPTAATQSRHGRCHSTRRLSRRPLTPRSLFRATDKQLQELSADGMKVSVCVIDLDHKSTVFSGDEYVTLPVAGLGVIPLLIEVAAEFERGTLSPWELAERSWVKKVGGGGIWQHMQAPRQHMQAPSLPLTDVATLAASTGDSLATNILLERVGLPAVRQRIEMLGMSRMALMDGFRDNRGPDDAPQVALGSADEFAELCASLANSEAVSAPVSERVTEWLCRNQDLGLVASSMGLDPFDHENDQHRLILLNKTGRAPGVRADAGVIAGPRAGLAYCLIVCFDDLSLLHRLRAHEAFRTLGTDLLECVL